MTVRIGALKVVFAVAAVLCGTASLHAQPQQPSAQQPNGPPNALQGFSQNRDKPIKINSATLEVRDKDKVATFAGDVHLVQGDTTMRSKILVVFYEDDSAAKPAKPVAPPAGTSQTVAQPGQQIKRVEAKGGVIVVQKDQTATGENGVFDMRANTVTLLGNVVISQGPNVVKGDRLTVDMTTGVSRVESGKGPGQGRVQALIQPGPGKPEGHSQESAPSRDTPSRDTPRQRAQQPSGLY
jgi:lipopolysaccharide export system protein LptA